jgi:hypothetical protein
VEKTIREGIQIKQLYDQAESEVNGASERIMLLGGVLVDRHKLRAQKAQRDALASRLREAIEAIQRHGCVVKDLDIGLIDFPTYFRGAEVYLCWKLGEPGIAFWHGVDEGFRGRKPVDQEFLDNHSAEE